MLNFYSNLDDLKLISLILQRFQLVSETAANMMTSLEHCLTLFHQQEDLRTLQFNQEKEKCRVLEEALNVLAKEHHELEQSVASHISETGTIPRSLSCKSSRIYDTDDEYFDAFEEESDTDTLVTADSIFNSPAESVQDLTLGEGTSDLSNRKTRHRRRSHRRGSAHTLTNDNSSSSSSSSISTTYHTQPSSSSLRQSGANKSRTSSDSSSSNSNTLVDNNLSLASSCATLISEGGDAYRCARSDFYSCSNRLRRCGDDLIDLKSTKHR